MKVVLAILFTVLALNEASDFVCQPGKYRQTLRLKPGISYTYNSNPEGAAKYQARQSCTLNLRPMKTCKKIKFSCQSFDVDNKDGNTCRKGDKFFIGKQVFCKTNGPDVVLTGRQRISFRSNKRIEKSGAQCTFECTDGTDTTAQNTTTPAPKDCYCGLAQREKRIVGGVETEVNEYPWQIGLASRGSSWPWCGGSLLNSKWVLTAAHCVDGNTAAGDLNVILGEHNYRDTTETQKVDMAVEAIHIHPGYRKFSMANDFALLKLAEEVDYAAYPHIRPVCLPVNNKNDYAGDKAIVSGWGTLQSGGSQPNELQEVEVVVLSLKQCKRNYGYDGSEIKANMLCAGVKAGGKDSCQGDSGGPLFWTRGNGENPGQNYFQIGVVSWGYGCAEAEHPGVYARVTSALEWINSYIATEGKMCPRI